MVTIIYYDFHNTSDVQFDVSTLLSQSMLIYVFTDVCLLPYPRYLLHQMVS